MNKKIMFTILFTLCVISYLYSGGFQINEQGAKAMGMAGAYTALADDPSAVYYNPAGITQLNGTQIMAGLTLISPKSSFRGVSPEITEYKMKELLFNPINFYLTHRINSKMAAGFGINNPYGLGSEWNEDWIGKYIAGKTEVATFFFLSVIAYDLMHNLSLSMGPTFAFGEVEIVKMTGLAPFVGDAKVTLKGDDNSAWGFSAGALYKAMEDKLSFGLSYKSEVEFNFEGTVTSDGPSAIEDSLPSGDISAKLTTPLNLTFGMAYKLIPELTLTADYQYIGWSCYDTLAIDFKKNSEWNIKAPKNYENTYILRFGCEYSLNDNLDLRTGILYDNNPVKDEWVDPMLPDANRIGLNFGFGYEFKNITIDVAYLLLRFDQRKITDSKVNYTDGDAPFNGVYNSIANLVGFNLSYKF